MIPAHTFLGPQAHWRLVLAASLSTLAGTAASQLPPGITPYGSPTGGCAGFATMSATSSPTLGNTTFAVTCAGALPLAPGVLPLGSRDLATPIVFMTAQIWVALQGAFLIPVTINSAGAGRVNLPVPRSAALAGGNLYAQFLWSDTGPSCAANVLAATDALHMVMQCPTPDADEPNNDRSQATPIRAGATLTRYLCPTGDEDWYVIVVTGNGRLTAGMTPAVGRNYDLQLLDATQVLATSAQSGSTRESIARCMTAGTYWLRVYGAAGAFDPFSPYTLDASVTGSSTTTIPSGPVTVGGGFYHPVLDTGEISTRTTCPENITLTISGDFATGCASLPLEIWGGDIGGFPSRLAATTIGGTGSFFVSGTFRATSGVNYRYALRNSGPSACTAALPPPGGAAVLTITRN